jgi:hypothetical protein
MKKSRVPILLVLVALLLALAGCVSSEFTQFEYWDHDMTAAEFTPHDTLNCLVYTYEDARFNNADFFDMRMINEDGLSDFDSVYDENLMVFLYQPMYDGGSVTWFAHTGADAVLAGETLRFYHIWK